MLKADLHVHTCYSRDCLVSPGQVIEACVKRGLDCIAVTDHNEIKGALVLQEKAPFKVIVGEEIHTDRGEVIGYFLKDRIKPGMSPLRTVEEIKEQGGLVCIPHPFDRLRRSRLHPDAFKEIEGYIDIIEVFNARNIYAEDNERAREYAAVSGAMVSVGTDAHWPWEIGRSYMDIPVFEGAGSFTEAMQSVSPVFTGSLRKSGLLVHVGTKTLKLLGRRGAY
ncbi:MAG: phosphotransferase [Firmicutes bacterium HGW-Firmicutes-14]|nr:MAG: phosphotransferase [Firmicutes bacterium HGW-Firmicutes-14]